MRWGSALAALAVAVAAGCATPVDAAPDRDELLALAERWNELIRTPPDELSEAERAEEQRVGRALRRAVVDPQHHRPDWWPESREDDWYGVVYEVKPEHDFLHALPLEALPTDDGDRLPNLTIQMEVDPSLPQEHLGGTLLALGDASRTDALQQLGFEFERQTGLGPLVYAGERATREVLVRRAPSARWLVLAFGEGTVPDWLDAETIGSLDLRHCDQAHLLLPATGEDLRIEGARIRALQEALARAGVSFASLTLWEPGDPLGGLGVDVLTDCVGNRHVVVLSSLANPGPPRDRHVWVRSSRRLAAAPVAD